MRDTALAEEVVQEVFLRIWRSRADLARIEVPDQFVYRITQNVIYDQLEIIIKAREAGKGYAAEHKNTVTEAAWIFDEEMKELLNRAVEKLPDQQQTVFRMAKDNGLTHEQIGQELGISRWTVKNHMSKAITTLYELLKPHLLKGILLAIFSEIQ